MASEQQREYDSCANRAERDESPDDAAEPACLLGLRLWLGARVVIIRQAPLSLLETPLT